MAVATEPSTHPDAAERPAVLAVTVQVRQLESELGEVRAAGRQLAQRINRDLVVPASVLDLLAAHVAMPADLRPMVLAARAALRDTASQAEELQAVVGRCA